MRPSVSRFWPQQAPDEPRHHLTASEAAAILGVTAASVRRWVALSLLPARRMGPGRRILIDPSDLECLFSSDPLAAAQAQEPVDGDHEDGDDHGADASLIEAVEP